MGKKSRGGIDEPDHRGLAPEANWAAPAGSDTASWAQVRTSGEAFAALTLIGAYLEYRVHGSSGPEALGPQRPAESDTDFALRRQVGTALSGIQARMGGVPERAASLLSTVVSPALATGVVACLLVEGGDLLKGDTADIDPVVWQSDAHRALDDMCPREHRRQAVKQLPLLSQGRLAWTEQVERNARRAPVATIHAAAALVAWLYAQPSLVDDPLTARLNVGQRAQVHLGQMEAGHLAVQR